MSIKAFLKNILWRHQNLGIQKTDFGTKLRINSFMDHLVYKEIFTDKIYDKYIFHALEKCADNNEPKKIFDFGANLGFFSIRCCEIWNQLGSKTRLNIVLFEPSENCIYRIKPNLKRLASQNFSFEIHNCLVGKKNGWDWFIEDRDHHIGQCVSKRIESKGHRYSRKVNYTDLTKDLENSNIELIKCDIEGSEIEFFKNYSVSLRNVNSIIIETHGYEAKDYVCNKMKEIGFTSYKDIQYNKKSKYCNLFFINKKYM